MRRRTALVTGGSRRIGRAIVERLHRDGFNILVHCNKSIDAANQIVAALNLSRPNSAAVACCDLADNGDLKERCEGLVRQCAAIFASIDVLVNNASTFVPTPLQEESSAIEADFRCVMGSNATAPFWLVRAFAAQHGSQSQGGASIVNLSDSMAARPLVGYTAYTMAKAALEALTRSAAVELGPSGIRVNAVAPGLNVLPPGVDMDEAARLSGSVPLGHRIGTPEDVADIVAFLVSGEAAYITGQIIAVDGAWSLVRSSRV